MAFSDPVGANAGRPGSRARPSGGRPRGRLRRGSVSRPYPPQAASCRELDCVRGIVPQRVLAAAEERARAIGIGADRVLICADAITEDAYLHALAASLGTSYVRLDALTRADVPLSDAELVRAAAAGLMPIREAGRIVWLIAPSCWAAHRLTDPRRPIQQWIKSFRLTSSDRLQRFITKHAQATLGRRAAYDLRRTRPEFSNAAP